MLFRSPSPLPLSEVFIGLQTGVIDGQENPLAQIWGSKLHEVQEYLSMTGHVYTPAYVVVSPTRWSGLPDGVRAVLEEEARATQAFVHETAARLDAELLLCSVLGLSRVELYTNYDRPIAKPEVDAFRDLLRRRADREPVAYILGTKEFRSLDFRVDRRVHHVDAVDDPHREPGRRRPDPERWAEDRAVERVLFRVLCGSVEPRDPDLTRLDLVDELLRIKIGRAHV